MTSWFRGTLDLSLGSTDFAAAPAIRRARCLRRGAIDALHSTHLDFFRRRLRRHVVVEHLRFRLLDVLVDDDADDDVLVAAEGAADADTVTFADHAMRLGVLAVDVDLPALACTLGLRACLEQTGDVQPDVETDTLVHASMFAVLSSCSG